MRRALEPPPLANRVASARMTAWEDEAILNLRGAAGGTGRRRQARPATHGKANKTKQTTKSGLNAKLTGSSSSVHGNSTWFVLGQRRLCRGILVSILLSGPEGSGKKGEAREGAREGVRLKSEEAQRRLNERGWAGRMTPVPRTCLGRAREMR